MAGLPICNSSLHLSRAAKFRITAKFFDTVCSFFFLKKKLLSWLSGKEAACDAGDTGDAGSVPGQEDPLEKEVAIHSSILA